MGNSSRKQKAQSAKEGKKDNKRKDKNGNELEIREISMEQFSNMAILTGYSFIFMTPDTRYLVIQAPIFIKELTTVTIFNTKMEQIMCKYEYKFSQDAISLATSTHNSKYIFFKQGLRQMAQWSTKYKVIVHIFNQPDDILSICAHMNEFFLSSSQKAIYKWDVERKQLLATFQITKQHLGTEIYLKGNHLYGYLELKKGTDAKNNPLDLKITIINNEQEKDCLFTPDFKTIYYHQSGCNDFALKKMGTQDVKNFPNQQRIFRQGFTRDGKYLITIDSRYTKIWNLETQQLKRMLDKEIFLVLDQKKNCSGIILDKHFYFWNESVFAVL